MITKILFLIASEKGYEVLRASINSNKKCIGFVSTFTEVNVQESYTSKIEDLCKENQIEFITWSQLKNCLVERIKEFEISEIVTVGWKYLLPLSLNQYLRNPIIVFHDSLLPKYRGFSPTPTAIICGEEEIGISAIFASDKVDEGEIILQKKTRIPKDFYIKDIIGIQGRLCSQAIVELIEKIENNKMESYKQNEEEATYSIWRNPEDCEINWNKSSDDIYNLIRATGYPYTGSYTYLGADRIYIWESKVEKDYCFVDRHPGKLWSIDEEKHPIVICGRGMLKITKITDEKGNDYSFGKLRVRLGRW